MQSTIAALANLFASALVAISVIILLGTVFLALFVAEIGGFGMAAGTVGLGLIALIVCGASAVLVDIMNNVRNMNQTAENGAIRPLTNKLDEILDALKSPINSFTAPPSPERNTLGDDISSTVITGIESSDETHEAKSETSDNSSGTAKPKGPVAEIYKDVEITRDGAYCVVDGERFFSLRQARQFIDRQKRLS
jgi:hypothetical protein